MNDHIGELAALRALGSLEEPERLAVEAHIGRCDPCTKLLAQAQDDVTTIAMAEPQHAAPPKLAARVARIAARDETPVRTSRGRVMTTRWIAALAAAIALVAFPFGFLVRQNIAMHQAIATESDAIARISTSEHRNVAFTPVRAPHGDMAAHVMYGPDGSWYCVIVRGVTRPLHVVWSHGGERTMLGTAMPHDNVAMLYLPKSHRMDQLALMDDGEVVGSAQLAFQ